MIQTLTLYMKRFVFPTVLIQIRNQIANLTAYTQLAQRLSMNQIDVRGFQYLILNIFRSWQVLPSNKYNFTRQNSFWIWQWKLGKILRRHSCFMVGLLGYGSHICYLLYHIHYYSQSYGQTPHLRFPCTHFLVAFRSWILCIYRGSYLQR